MEQTHRRLMSYAIAWLADWCGQESGDLVKGLPDDARPWLEPYRKVLAGGGDIPPGPKPGSPLLSIFSRVRKDNVDPPQCYWRAEELMLEQPPTPAEAAEAQKANLGILWQGFEQDMARLRELPEALRFEAFAHLLHKWAWAVPCSYGEAGVSLYDEFRALSALVYASDCEGQPAEQFLLVGGDIPGIQKTIYTITSKGAAKGLRGRSFFIQLLGDAVVRRLLADLELPETNVVYAAGGNFMLLVPIHAQKTISKRARQINERLLEAFEGDLALCVVCEPLPAMSVGRAAFAQKVSRALHRKLNREKRRRFAEIASKNWEKVFGAQGQGGVDFCIVCQRESRKGERGKRTDDGWKCDHCIGFEELAQTISPKRLFMFTSAREPDSSAKNWQKLLWQLTDWCYDFAPSVHDPPVGARAYSIDHVGFLTEHAHGFRLIANTTPRDNKGQVRTFEDMADGSTGLERVGVLRMDVDDLGQVLTRWMPDRTMAATSALSNALDRFFVGWLDAICQEVTDKPLMKGLPAKRGDLLYVIYAGGDDLFIVGAWDLMPLLAERIRERFCQYVGDHPDLHISAGITLEDRKFPLYRAAERAGEALDHGAKELIRTLKGLKIEKDAANFLGLTLGWETYPFVKQQAENLIHLVQDQNVPRSLLSVLRAIHARYLKDIERAEERALPEDRMYYGPWMWRKVYQLSRIQQRYSKEEIAQAIKALEAEVLIAKYMPYIGLATRWAEYLTRE